MEAKKVTEPREKHLAVLKKIFGHKEFRPTQWKIIQSIIEDKRDNCVIMATGYGKSLCYQYPPVFCEGLSIVVSPLISLMHDQVLSLKMKNIPACFLGSAQTKKSEVIKELLLGRYRLLYVTPEWCTSEYGEDILHQLTVQYVKVTLIAIDEAHCVSQWGHDFRKCYRHLSKIRKILPDIPIIALTATATPQVREDIISSLKLKNPQRICTSFDRPNLFLSASLKTADYLGDLKFIINKQKIENNSCGSSIIYCPTKKTAEKLYCALRSAGLKCNMYHAGLSDSVRAKAHDEFVKDIVEVMIATVAFGMGIDKPDVRLVIHYGAPKDLESYYQEIGRAGRDGLPSHCHTFYSQTDFTLNRGFLSGYSGGFKAHKEEMVRMMECYLQSMECRRKIILKHFSPNTKVEPRDPKECCDNCVKNGKGSGKAEINYDLTEDALLLLKAVKEMNERYGLMTYIFLLRGSSNKRLHERYHSSNLFGAGREKTEPWWKLLGGLLLGEYLLEESISNFGQGWNSNNFPVKIVKLSEKGRLYLNRNGETAHFEPTPEMLKMIHKIPRKTPDGWIEMSKICEYEATDGDNSNQRNAMLENEIFDQLLKFRTVVAEKLNCMPYMVLDNRSIQDLTMKQPKTVEDLALEVNQSFTQFPLLAKPLSGSAIPSSELRLLCAVLEIGPSIRLHITGLSSADGTSGPESGLANKGNCVKLWFSTKIAIKSIFTHIEGINEAKIKNFGKECLECITKVIESHKSAGPSTNKMVSMKRFMKNFAFKPSTQVLRYEDDVEENTKSETLQEETSEYFTCQDTTSAKEIDPCKSPEETVKNDNFEDSFADDHIFDGDILAAVDEIEMKAKSVFQKDESVVIPQKTENKEIGFKRKRPDEVFSPQTTCINSTSLVDMVKINKEKKKEMKKKIKI